APAETVAPDATAGPAAAVGTAGPTATAGLADPSPADSASPLAAPAPAAESSRTENGRARALARIAYFLPRFSQVARPEPHPGEPVAEAWGEWFPLLNGDGLASDDQRALIVRHDFGDGRVWGTGSISLVALSPVAQSPTSLRYDFTAT